MAGWDQLTREQLLVVVAEQATLIQTLTEQVQALTAQVAELTRLLGQNSGNSSLPPSTDRGRGPSRPRRGSNRKPGKQPGAPGSTLEIVTDPDEVIDHLPGACGGCGADLGDAACRTARAERLRPRQAGPLISTCAALRRPKR